MDSFDTIQIGDTVVLVATKEDDGTLYVPDYTVSNHNAYRARFVAMVLAVRPKGKYGAEDHGAILIQKELLNDKSHNWDTYSDYYKDKHESIPTPGARYWEIYSPFNIVEHRPGHKTVQTAHGMTCCECRNGYPYAEANFGDKLVCWSCRDSLRWKYKMVDGKVQLL